MSSARHKSAARRNVKKAAASAKSRKTIAHLSKATRKALGNFAAAFAHNAFIKCVHHSVLV